MWTLQPSFLICRQVCPSDLKGALTASISCRDRQNYVYRHISVLLPPGIIEMLNILFFKNKDNIILIPCIPLVWPSVCWLPKPPSPLQFVSQAQPIFKCFTIPVLVQQIITENLSWNQLPRVWAVAECSVSHLEHVPPLNGYQRIPLVGWPGTALPFFFLDLLSR